MIKLYKGDCLIESDSVDLILTDLPYGTVKDIKNVNHGMSGKCDWDIVINGLGIRNGCLSVHRIWQLFFIPCYLTGATLIITKF